MHMNRIVLAYSGGLDTSVAIPWLAENYDAEVVAVTLDLGQGENLGAARERALSTGAVNAYVVDVRQEFAHRFILPTTRSGSTCRRERSTPPLPSSRLPANGA